MNSLAVYRKPLASAACVIALMLTGCGPAAAAPGPGPAAFELTPRQRLIFADGRVTSADDAKAAGVTFGVIPTSTVTAKPYYNVFTGIVESRPVAGNPHPTPVLRAAKVSVYRDKPDVATLAIDRLIFGNEAEVRSDSGYAIASDGNHTVRLITFTSVSVPQDRIEDWRLAGTVEPLTLPEHIDDPVADRGRAVLAKEPLPIKGRLLYGTRKQNWGPAELYALDLPSGAPTKIGDATEPRLSVSGSVADRVDMRTLRVTDRRGKLVGQIQFEHDEIAEFNISPDGQRVALCSERMVDVPDALPKRELVTLVYTAKGRKVGEFLGYDDPAFMPDGRVLLTGGGGNAGLFIGDPKSGRVEPLLIKDGPGNKPLPEWPRMPAVSPDGKWVAYVTQRDVCVVGTDGHGWTPVWDTRFKEPQHAPTFSPDSSLVALVVVPLNVMTGPGLVSVFDLKKHVRQPIETSQGADSEIPLVWQP